MTDVQRGAENIIERANSTSILALRCLGIGWTYRVIAFVALPTPTTARFARGPKQIHGGSGSKSCGPYVSKFDDPSALKRVHGLAADRLQAGQANWVTMGWSTVDGEGEWCLWSPSSKLGSDAKSHDERRQC